MLMNLTEEERLTLVTRALARGPMCHYSRRLPGKPEDQARLREILRTGMPLHVHELVAADNNRRPSLGRKDAIKAA